MIRWRPRSVIASAIIPAMLLVVTSTLAFASVLRGQTTVVADRSGLASVRVTVDVDRVPLPTVLKAITTQAGLKAAYTGGTVPPDLLITLHVKDVPVADAFRAALQGTGLVARVHETGTVTIAHDREDPNVSGTVTGTITDAKTHQPIDGVILVLDDTVARTRTQKDGHFTFATVAAGTHRIAARAVGFGRQVKIVTVVDDQTTTITMALEPSESVNTLNQVVVTATGEQRIRELGHVVATVNADSLVKEAPITTTMDLLQSRIPGLQVITSNGGVAGGNTSLRLRGTSSYVLSSEPIVIVDGVRYKSNNLITEGTSVHQDYRGDSRGRGELQSPLDQINPNDIESIEVAKGPSASTLYGPDAANGVIIIKTKRGAPGATRFQWYVRPVSNAVPKTRIDRGYQAWGHDPITGALYSGNCSVITQYQGQQCILDSITAARTIASDNRYSIIAKDRPTWQYGANLQGGSQLLRYFLSGNYDSQIGALQIAPAAADYLKKYLATSSLGDALERPNTLLNLGTHGTVSADWGDKGNVTLTVNYTHTDHRMQQLGEFQDDLNHGAPHPGIDTSSAIHLYYFINPEFTLTTTSETGNHYVGALNGTRQLLPWFSVSASAGIDLDATITHSVLPAGVSQYYAPTGFAQDDDRNNTGRTFTLGSTAINRPGIFSFRSSIGTQYNYAHLDGLTAYAENLAPGRTTVNAGSYQSVTPYWSESASLGAYGEEVVGAFDRLFLTGALRMDGSTTFGDAYHARPYPKVGASWIVSEEPFMRSVPWISEARFRTSYGAASRYPTSQMKLGSINGNASIYQNQSQIVYALGSAPSALLRPERTNEGEYGADATFFSRLTMGLTWNRRTTKDFLFDLVYPVGVPSVWANVGDLKSRGFEATATLTLLDAGSMRSDVVFGYSHSSQIVTSLGNIPQNKSSSGRGFAVGYPIDAVFGHRILGVADTVSTGPNHPGDGIILYNEVIRDTAMSFLGVTAPPTTLTITPTLSVFGGRVRLSALFDRETGFIRYNSFAPNCPGSGLCLAPFLTTTPVLIQAKYASGMPEDWWESGNFTRWREFNVTYELPQHLLRLDRLHLGFSRASISLQGRNLALWTKYDGTDPESVTGNISAPGALSGQGDGVPQARSWSFRFDITP